jgi:hypothetical protein
MAPKDAVKPSQSVMTVRTLDAFVRQMVLPAAKNAVGRPRKQAADPFALVSKDASVDDDGAPSTSAAAPANRPAPDTQDDPEQPEKQEDGSAAYKAKAIARVAKKARVEQRAERKSGITLCFTPAGTGSQCIACSWAKAKPVIVVNKLHNQSVHMESFQHKMLQQYNLHLMGAGASCSTSTCDCCVCLAVLPSTEASL